MKYFRYIITLILAISLFSCEDYLDKQPTDQLSLATFWKTEQDARMALAGVYSKMQIRTITGNDWGAGIGHWDCLTDNAYCPFAWEHAFQTIANGGQNASMGLHTVIGDLYTDGYKAIAACNGFLDNIDNVNADEAVLAKYKGEVRFLRAFIYYWLVQCWGDVPLVDRTITIEEMNLKRAARAEVLNFIYEDLDYAIANLPDKAYSPEGHVVKASAIALKAKIKMFNKEWGEAASLARQIMDGGKFVLAENYKSNFESDLGQANCPEIIFSVKFQIPGSYNNSDVIYGLWGSVLPLEDYINSHEPGDKRLGWNVVQAGEDWVLGPNNISSPIFPEGRTITNTALLKWVNDGALGSDYAQRDNDCTHIRFAEVLLVYAESKNEAEGPDASVYESVNLIRSRAGLDPLPIGLTQDQMRVKIRNERRVELAFEAQRYFDLKRWDLAKTIIPTIFDPPNQTITTRKWEPHFEFWPITQSEIDKDPENMKQTPGY